MKLRCRTYAMLLATVVAALLSACSRTGPEFTGMGTANADEAVATVPGCEGTATPDFADYMKPGWQTQEGWFQRIIIASDPQPFRTMLSRVPFNVDINKSRWNDWRWTNFKATLRRDRMAEYVPMVVNGDMTDYGHGEERQALFAFLRETYEPASNNLVKGPLMLPGLGNHDYDQNVGNCSNNGCARDAVCDHIAWVTALKAHANGLNFDYSYNAGGRRHRGSLAYSVDVGRIHIVQLNNEPTYSNTFASGFPTQTHFEITQSMDWLERDLQAAYAKKQYTLVNMHRWNWQDESQFDRFKSIIKANGVIGIFYGHEHEELGYAKRIEGIPLFHDGALLARSYLKVDFDWNRHVVQVKAVADEEEVQVYEYDMDTLGGVSDPDPGPKPNGPVRLTLYADRNFEGKSCKLEVRPGGTQPVIGVINFHCLQVVKRAHMSMRVENFYGNRLHLCLGINGGVAQCYGGNYVGDFNVLDISGDHSELPSEMKARPIIGPGGGANYFYYGWGAE